MATNIRRATLTDLNELIRWRMKSLREAFAGKKDVDYTSLRQAQLNFYRRAISMESYLACFADQGYTSVGNGCLVFCQEPPTPDNPSGHCAYLMSIYTPPELRNQGIGKRIINWLVKQAHKRGITKIYMNEPQVALPKCDFAAEA